MTEPGLYIYAVPVSKNEPDRVVSSLVQGYRIANNEDEARGMAAKSAAELKPDFMMGEILVLRVPDGALIAAQAASRTKADFKTALKTAQEPDGETQ